MNKSLLRAAAVFNIALASLIYVACSGEDGAKGDAGASCLATPSVTVPGGFDLACGGVYVGTLPPGAQGPQGPGGGLGGDSTGFDGCYLLQIPASTSFSVICGEDVAGTLSPTVGGGCNISTSPGSAYFTIACPGQSDTRLAKAICSYRESNVDKAVAYDPETQLCSLDPSTPGVKGNCEGTGYLVGTQFCAKKAAEDLTRSILARCGATVDAETGEFIVDGTYNPITQFCSAPTLPASGTSAGQIQGNTIIAGIVKELCGIGPNPATVGSKYGSVDGRYTTNDFCAAQDNTVYPICGTSPTFNPVSSFCLVANASANPQVGTVTASGVVTARCGTSGTNNDGEFYSNDNFCDNAVVYPLCKSTSVTSGVATETAVGAENGKYNVAQQYCSVTVGTKTDADNYTLTAAIVSQPLCGTTPYNADKDFCHVATSTIYPICEGLSTYDVAKNICDTRGADIYKAYAALPAATETVKSRGGKLYGTITIGILPNSQTWIAENLLQTTGSYVIPSAAGFTWSAAQKACPTGWRLPNNADWEKLVANAGGQNAALNLRPASGLYSEAWVANPAVLDTTGFNAINKAASSTNARDLVTIGIDLANGTPPSTVGSGVYAAWWSITENVETQGVIANDAYFKAIIDQNVSIYTGVFNKLATTIDVRCIKETL